MGTVTADDFFAIGFLVFLEGILSIDNALVLALIVRALPKHLQKRALTYGIVGAVVFRVIAISLAAFLMQWTWVKFVGGGYLLYLSLPYWWTNRKEKEDEQAEIAKAVHRSFWMTVVIVELTDIAFAIDSILTAVALTKDTWVVMTGGFLGLLMMRFAASMFIGLLEKFPRFEPTAYLLVFIIGAKLIVDGFHFPQVDFHSFHNPAFWIFWVGMAVSLAFGFTKRGEKVAKEHHVETRP
jgi:YkoY family integral membrane protein